MKVYAVVFANYEPAEVDSLWERREDAEAQATTRNQKTDWAAWQVVEWDVRPPADARTAVSEEFTHLAPPPWADDPRSE